MSFVPSALPKSKYNLLSAAAVRSLAAEKTTPVPAPIFMVWSAAELSAPRLTLPAASVVEAVIVTLPLLAAVVILPIVLAAPTTSPIVISTSAASTPSAPSSPILPPSLFALSVIVPLVFIAPTLASVPLAAVIQHYPRYRKLQR